MSRPCENCGSDGFCDVFYPDLSEDHTVWWCWECREEETRQRASQGGMARLIEQRGHEYIEYLDRLRAGEQPPPPDDVDVSSDAETASDETSDDTSQQTALTDF